MASEAKSDLTSVFVMVKTHFLIPFGVLTLGLFAFLNSFVRRLRRRKNLQFLDLRLESRR